MIRRATCLKCGATCNVNALRRGECWGCETEAEQSQEESNFADFMSLAENQRWRRLWEAAGKPGAY